MTPSAAIGHNETQVKEGSPGAARAIVVARNVQKALEQGDQNMRWYRIAFLSFVAAFWMGIGEGSADSITWSPGLTDRELALQRWFSYLTFMQGHDTAPWTDWYDDGNQLDVTAFRYQFAFCGYGCAAMAAKTPAYRELIEDQLYDLCERMIDRRTWFWVTHYWDYGDGPPDPCQYENVMYTGHLTQLMCLYELMTGDMRYSNTGWDFTWEDGRAVHYTLEKAIAGLYKQSRDNSTGGICCEPGMIFVDCNSHSASSFILFDTVHKTSYSDANQKWFDWMRVHFRNRVPFARPYLYAIYDQNRGLFIPVGDVGADGWALGFGYPWFPDDQFFKNGWRRMYRRAKWHYPAPGQAYAQNNKIIGCCAGGSLNVSNSFIPLVGVQAEGQESPRAQKVLRWLEASFGTPLDTDADGFAESYFYDVCPMKKISSTGIIATALATDRDSMRNLYRTPRTDLIAAPTLSHVDYPKVCVRAAEYRAPVLRFVVFKGVPSFTGNTTLVCSQIPGRAAVLRDGVPWSAMSQDGATVRIISDVDSEHVFEVRCVPEQ